MTSDTNPETDPFPKNTFICSNCYDFDHTNRKVSEKVCILSTDHKPRLCVEDSNNRADWYLTTRAEA